MLFPKAPDILTGIWFLTDKKWMQNKDAIAVKET